VAGTDSALSGQPFAHMGRSQGRRMLQILQSLRDGDTQLVDVPCPQVRPGTLLLKTRRTLISAGTERMLQEFGKAGWIGKARQQPDKVRQVLDKVKTDGLFTTLDAVFDKLDEPLPLGYCHVGEVLEVGPGVTGFEPGDRVLSNGPHAEVVCVPQNLCARIPDGVSDDAAAFGVLCAIALQGIRLLQPTLGECVLVSGLGLIGLLAVQLLKAHGTRVIGADFQPARLEQARKFGAETIQLGRDDLKAQCAAFSRGRGMDAVLITAATKSDEPVHQAATVCRKRGRIVLTGVVGLQLSRDDFYKKELSFQVSCSYGPGRYDPAYEDRGQDYPAAYVRWTEQRNFEAVLDMLADGRLDTESLWLRPGAAGL
jgi:threonine dehydrogenase-like Zn-dependent dehydrogenase